MTGFNPFDNPEFRRELSELLDQKLSPLAGKQEATEALVQEHEAFRQRSKGALASLAIVWSIFVAGLEYLFHRHSA